MSAQQLHQNQREKLRTATMELPDVARSARNFSAMVRIQGPDPKGLKMRRHAFHLHRSGITTLSASGLLLPPKSLHHTPTIIDHVCSLHHHSGAVIITSASLVEPFLTMEQRDYWNDQEFFPKLLPDTRIDVLVEGLVKGSCSDQTNSALRWLQAQLLALVDVSASFVDLQSLIKGQNGYLMHHSWDVGWNFMPQNYDHLHGRDAQGQMFSKGGRELRPLLEPNNNDVSNDINDLALKMKSATRIAFLGIPAVDLKDKLHMEISQVQKKGDVVLAMGSPFGILSPSHFFNSVCVGAVANFYPNADRSSLMMADIRCLPGMEGAPVFDQHACLSGILTSPLRQKEGGAEIQLVITWDAITTICHHGEPKVNKDETHSEMKRIGRSSFNCSDNYRRSVKYSLKGPDLPCISESAFEKAISSIALVTVGDGAWASGVILNSSGLILTNAHLVEPWRFGKSSLMGLTEKSATDPGGREMSLSGHFGNRIGVGRGILPSSHFGDSVASLPYGKETTFINMNTKSYRRISVCLSHREPEIWSDARVVYISKGPLDVALLQLESVSGQLHSITPGTVCPSTGAKVYVIGHGLLGPWSGIGPSVSTGVLSKMIRIPDPFCNDGSSIIENPGKDLPVMLQTTAAVHPGASGGAVLNADGHMIGLVTSNAKHGSGTIIPHMNFSIPCAALEPIFKFSEKQDMSILKVLDRPNKLLSSIWELAPPPTSSNKSLPEEKNEGKGSRFSKFLAERRDIMKKESRHDICRPSKM